MSTVSLPKKTRAGHKPNALGLTLYAGTGVWDDWVRILYFEKNVDDATLVRITPGIPNEDLLVINPEHHLPALAERDVLITGQRVIAEYLDERYPHPRMLPTDPAGRARIRMVLERFSSELFPILTAALNSRPTTKDAKRFAEMVQESNRWFSASGYFVGTEFSQADCAWAVWLKGALKLKHPLPENTRAYLERIAKRPSINAYLRAR